MTEGYNAETEEGGEEINDKYKTGAATPPQNRINEESDRDSDINKNTEEETITKRRYPKRNR